MTEENKENKKEEILLGFVPQRLEIKGRPELINFPLSVLFASLKQDENSKKTIKASALYEPALYTFKDDEEKQSMVYVNRYGKCYLEIFYSKGRGDYVGKKYVNDELVLESTGADWNGFFRHFTVLGLSEGEAHLVE